MHGPHGSMPVLVTGGTGMLGRRVVPRLQAAGWSVRVLTRRHTPDHDGVRYVTGDLLVNEGIDAAVEGVAVIVHCAGNGRGDATMTHNLVRAVAAQAGTPHLVFISVVGADRVPVSGIDRLLFFYFQNKLEAERVVADSGLPWTTLRATQFYDLILWVAQKLTALPLVPVPAGIRFQPVETDEVAARLVELALGAPAGLVPGMAGPRIYGLDELTQSYLAATQRQRPIVSVPLPTKAAGAIRAGANLAPEQAVGHRTWEEFLADRVGTVQREDSPRSRPDLRERVAAEVLRLFNPLARRLIAAGMPTGAPNILLTVRGRRSGTPRTVPVGLLELEGRRFVQASYGVAGWALNLRADGKATITDHAGRVPVQAVELPPEEAGTILRRALQPYRQSRLLRALLGPRWRPPVALLGQYRIRVDETPEEYVAEAQRHPLFELRPIQAPCGGSVS
jgi:deazaflavin-dependent oxidoreductase (nitroreductase family)